MSPTLHGLPAATAAAAAVSLLVSPRVRGARAPRRDRGPREEQALLLRLRPALVGLAFLGGWTLVGGAPGVVAGSAGAVLAWRVLGSAESPATRRRREELERDLPTAVHLLGACLAAGAATGGALDTVAGALPGAVAEELLMIRHRLALGVDPVTVWGGVAAQSQLRPLGRAMLRAHRSGASVRSAIEGLADDLAGQARGRTDALARSVEVRAAAPLGVCFLPAFLLLGVVPMVVGVFSAMRIFA